MDIARRREDNRNTKEGPPRARRRITYFIVDCPFGRFACTCTYQLHFFVVVITWRRLPLGVELRLLLRLGRCGGLRLPGVPHIRTGLRESAIGWCKWWCMVAQPLRAQDGTHLSYLSFSADGLHRPLHISPTCPFRQMVCTGHYTSLLLVLFGGCSAQAITHLSSLPFSSDSLHRPLHISRTCHFRRMVCTGHYTSLLLVLFGGWSAQAITHLSYLPFSATGVHPAVLQPQAPIDSIPYTLSCPCETSTLNLFCDMCGTCH